MVKVNFNTNLKDCFGKDIVSIETGEVQTIKDMVCVKLFSAGEGLTEEEKTKAYLLMLRIANSQEEIAIEDRESVLIKKICEKQLTVGAWGQLVSLLNGDKEE